MPILSDTHCHLYLHEFTDDIEIVIKRAVSFGVQRILVPGIDLITSQKCIELNEKYPDLIFAAIGIHPNNSTDFDHYKLKNFEELLNFPNIVAIGEIGLDFYREKSSVEDQINIFHKMLNISRQSGKPVCIHNRNADSKIIEILDAWYSNIKISNPALANHPGVFHSFSGSETISNWAMNHKFYLGIGGPITYPKSLDLQKMIKNADIDHLILETDSPFLSPQQFRGKRNEPSYVRFVAEKIAEIKNIRISEVITKTSDNAKSIFGW